MSSSSGVNARARSVSAPLPGRARAEGTHTEGTQAPARLTPEQARQVTLGKLVALGIDEGLARQLVDALKCPWLDLRGCDQQAEAVRSLPDAAWNVLDEHADLAGEEPIRHAVLGPELSRGGKALADGLCGLRAMDSLMVCVPSSGDTLDFLAMGLRLERLAIHGHLDRKLEILVDPAMEANAWVGIGAVQVSGEGSQSRVVYGDTGRSMPLDLRRAIGESSSSSSSSQASDSEPAPGHPHREAFELLMGRLRTGQADVQSALSLAPGAPYVPDADEAADFIELLAARALESSEWTVPLCRVVQWMDLSALAGERSERLFSDLVLAQPGNSLHARAAAILLDRGAVREIRGDLLKSLCTKLLTFELQPFVDFVLKSDHVPQGLKAEVSGHVLEFCASRGLWNTAERFIEDEFKNNYFGTQERAQWHLARFVDRCLDARDLGEARRLQVHDLNDGYARRMEAACFVICAGALGERTKAALAHFLPEFHAGRSLLDTDMLDYLTHPDWLAELGLTRADMNRMARATRPAAPLAEGLEG